MACLTAQLRPSATGSCQFLTSVKHFSQNNEDWKRDSYQLLQQSPVRTDYFLRSLPRLPIPKLSATCERYLASQKALLANEEFKATEAVVTFLIYLYTAVTNRGRS